MSEQSSARTPRAAGCKERKNIPNLNLPRPRDPVFGPRITVTSVRPDAVTVDIAPAEFEDARVSFDFYGYPELELSPTGVISYLTALQPWFGTPALQGFSLLGLLVARDRNESVASALFLIEYAYSFAGFRRIFADP